MSKLERQRPYHFGRVFFPGKPNPVPTEVRLQPLGNHVGNVKRLVKQWEDFPCGEASRQRVLKAADLHDMGKPQRFSIQVETNSQEKFKNYVYSFRGHRFLAESEDAWAQALARGHHDFSVEDISRDTYILKKKSEYAKILNQNPLAYAHELYILEMCDQIEAELACRVIGDEEQAESRTFMDYTISKVDDQIYRLDFWPFKADCIELTFKYWTKQLSKHEQDKLKELYERDSDSKLGSKLDQIVKEWWHAQPSDLETQNLGVVLKPLSEKYLEQDVQAVYQRLAGFAPNPMQEEVFKAIAQTKHSAILLKGSTGSGKAETVLFSALTKGYRLFLPLPARSLLEDQKERIEKYLINFSALPENEDREVSIVVDTGSQMYRWVYKNGKDITPELHINPKRHLYKGDVILTTLDKFIYRYFAFGDKQKSFIFPLRIHWEKTLICFDEAHSYDEISFTNFQSLVRSLYEAGRSLVLMTATMPPEHHARFDYLDLIDYVDDSNRTAALNQFYVQTLKRLYLNKREFEWFSEVKRDSEAPDNFQDEFTQIVLKEWSSKAERRIIAVVETVRDAAAIYQQLKKALGSNTDSKGQFLFLYHGRVADHLRPELYSKIQQRDADKQPYILVTTSAIEVGCDLNAQVLISQICLPENLIQRAGRCNRKGDVPDAKVVLVGDRIPEFANNLDETGWQRYQKILQSLQHFDAHKISECISRLQHIDDYRVVEIFSMLHDYVYDADLTCKPAHEKGLVITRSWAPSVTLIYENGEKKSHKIAVPVARLLQSKENQYANTHVLESYYNQESTHWGTRSLTSGSAYLKDITIKIYRNHQGAEMFDDKEEYRYNPELGFVDLPGVFIKLKTNDFEEKLLCQHDKNTRQKIAIITYIKALGTKMVTQQFQKPSPDTGIA